MYHDVEVLSKIVCVDLAAGFGPGAIAIIKGYFE
jgi:hypothetical protein